MPAPEDADLEYYLGDNGTLGGPIDLGAALNELDANNVIDRPKILTISNSKRGVVYRYNASSGTLQNPKLAISTSGKKSSAGGVFRVCSSSGSDLGKVWLCFKVASAWFNEELNLNGTSWVNASQLIDVNSDWVLVSELGEPVGNLTIQIDGATVGTIRGSGDYSTKANLMACTLFQIAAATAIGGTVACADVDTDPTGTGSFSAAYQVPGDDQAISGPADIGPGDDWGYCLKISIPANMPMPYGRQVVADVELLGDPIA